MSDSGQNPPQRLPHTNPQGTAAPRPVISPGGAPRAPIQPPPAQRLPGQPGHAPQPVRAMPLNPAAPPPLPSSGGRSPIPTSIPLEDEGDVISLDDDDAAAPAAAPQAAAQATGAAAPPGQIPTASKIKISAGGDKHTYTRFKRNTHVAGTGACRVRTFHGRLSDDGLAYTDDKINEWLDNHPEVEIKHVNCLVGPLEGKVTGEQGLVVVIWY